jgi:Holliday junction DNA helicase RuvA
MIAFLQGKVINKGQNYAIIEVNNIGYQVFCGESFLNSFKIDEEIKVFTHHQVREEASDLYGFKNIDDLELFELLITVSGVGPKSALGVLTIASSNEVKEAIVNEDVSLLTKVSGIGKKTAERLVLELKTKVLRSGVKMQTINSASLGASDELEALMALGCSLSAAHAALNLVGPEIKDSGERVKAALKKMNKK